MIILLNQKMATYNQKLSDVIRIEQIMRRFENPEDSIIKDLAMALCHELGSLMVMHPGDKPKYQTRIFEVFDYFSTNDLAHDMIADLNFQQMYFRVKATKVWLRSSKHATNWLREDKKGEGNVVYLEFM